MFKGFKNPLPTPHKKESYTNLLLSIRKYDLYENHELKPVEDGPGLADTKISFLQGDAGQRHDSFCKKM